MKCSPLRWIWGAAALALMGCGGTASAPTGGFQMNIQWPRVSRLVPTATQSVRVLVQDAAGAQTFRVANRPASGTVSTLIFLGIQPGPLAVDARAYAVVDAQGAPLAQASTQVVVAGGGQANLQLSLTSTISRLEASAVRVDLAPTGTRTVAVTAKDSGGNLIPLTPSKLTWTSANTAVATVESSGTITAVAAGTTTVTITDTESGKSVTVTVGVS